jgi:hypothetical protein
MPFKKGQSGNPKGRPKGAGDKVTAEARALFIQIMEGEVGHIQDSLDGLRHESADKYLKALSGLFPYFMPKQQELAVSMDIQPTEPSWFDEVLERTDQKSSELLKDSNKASK